MPNRRPHHRRLRGAVAAGIVAAASIAQGAEPIESDRRALLLQKARLVEQLLASPRARDAAASQDASRQAGLARAREVLADARQALDAGDAARAQASIDEALRLTTAAFAARSAAPRDDALRQRNAELRQQVGTFRGALAAALPAPAAQDPTLATVDGLVAQADRASAEDRHPDAHQALAQAYQAATSALSALWAGKTVTLARKFDTPADEYRFEAERFRSHESLVDLAVIERRPDAPARAAMDQALAQARELRARAEARAAAGDHRAAIDLMDEATGHLLRALQAAGVPRF